MNNHEFIAAVLGFMIGGIIPFLIMLITFSNREDKLMELHNKIWRLEYKIQLYKTALAKFTERTKDL